MPIVKRKPRSHRPIRPDGIPQNPLYGYDYNPAWPSILSIAHDETNGGRVYLITDRPCVLISPAGLPLALAGLDILEAVEILPVKFRLWMSGPVPASAAWAWDAGGFGIVDPVTNHVLNASHGRCDDFPGPYAPPPAVVVATSASGTTCTLTFDQPVIRNGNMIDATILFDGQAPLAATNADANTIQFDCASAVAPGSTWQIIAQPAYLDTILAWPASGTL
ncbi:MAG: hypothetical protein JWN40_3752 [Phycisphaerales bacterium]|nr:hypothetical protein [Phycisphaerales bacterium]